MTQGVDFEGGTFCFQSGAEPLQVAPCAGTLLVYTADDSNIHSVEAVKAGERSTLTMWFTLLPEHQEDTKVCADCCWAARCHVGTACMS
jgi:predicted 2-oxoglutarate/Fe(II)-dependent dioxygenase YbiX